VSENVEDILHGKALDAIGHLLESYDAGKIGAEAFKVGVETVWTCLGGMVRKSEFHDLIQLANAEVRELPAQAQHTVLESPSKLVVISRIGELVHMRACVGGGQFKEQRFDLDEEAVEFVKRTTENAKNKGLMQV